jgi:hypothetical protein
MAGTHQDLDARLREALRDGDPAAADGGLLPDEREAIRRTLLRETSALPVRSRIRLWRPAFAAGLTMLLVVVLWTRTERQAKPVFDPAARPQAPAAIAVAAPTRAAVQPVSPPPPAIGGTPADAVQSTAPTVSRPSAPVPGPPARIDMITKGGTRIVWSVNPGVRF